MGQAVLIPLIGYLEISDTKIIPFLILTIIARHLIKGFAVDSWLMYFGSAVDMMGSYAFSAARSVTTKASSNNIFNEQ